MLVQGSGPALTEETNALLARRLQLATLLLSGGMTLFLVERLLGVRTLSIARHGLPLVLHVVAITVTAMVAARLRWGSPLSNQALRAAELLAFGTVGLFFAVVSYGVLVDAAEHG